MDFDYTKEKLLLIENINGQIEKFKSKILDIVYLEANNNIKFINNIEELKSNIRIYKNVIKKEKNIYTIILGFMFLCFSIYLTTCSLNFFSFYVLPTIILLCLIGIITINNTYYKIILCTNYLNNLCNNLIYNRKQKEKELLNKKL